MKIAANLFSILILFILTSCFEEEEFPDTPKIEFKNIAFVNSSSDVDSLKLTFSFEDGGANVGIIESSDIFFPYNQYLIFLDEDDSVITESRIGSIEGQIFVAQLITRNISLNSSGGQIFFSLLDDANHAVLAFDKQEYTDEISIEDFKCPNIFNQRDNLGRRIYDAESDIGLNVYTFESGATGSFLSFTEYRYNEDILVIPVNTHYNLFVEIQKENIDGIFEDIDYQGIFNSEDCLLGNFNGRIPWFSQDGESGTITYSILSRGLSTAFQENQIRLVFWVLDRNGNQSNKDSVDFTLPGITQ